MEEYNTRVVIFPDGTQRIHYSSHCYPLRTEEEKQALAENRKAWIAFKKELFETDFYTFVHLFGKNFDDVSELLYDPEKERIQYMKRAKQRVYDIARSNRFDLFLTLTFDPAVVDSFDYSAVVDKLESFTKFLRRHGSQYILVPEKHDSGRYHFHGLCTKSDIQLISALSPYSGLPLYDRQGRPIYNLPQYTLGHSTATFVSDPAKTASYLVKYLTKEIEVPKGKKCYWASRSCARPNIERTYIEESKLGDIVDGSRYIKAINNTYGDFLIAEKENA